jgi:arylsulfatase A-like enzyme
MVDDLGYGDVSFSAGAGSNDGLDTAKATPTLSSLASEGVVLTSFYAQPSCTPSRASFLTGKYTTSIGLQDSVIHATEPRGLSLDEDILPQRLSAAGYQTMGVGKWHVGFHQPQYSPTQRGFEEYFGILTGGGGHFNHQSTASFTMRGPYKETQVDFSGSNLWHNGAAVDDEDKLVKGQHTTDIYTNVAVAQLSAAHAASSTTPFFLFLSYQAVHAPMEVPPHYVDGTIDNGCDAVSLYDSDAYGDKRKTLCGMLSQLDDSAKTVVNHLKSDAMGNAWDNTVLVFLSDNGGVLAHGSSNAPFAGEKGTFSEGGVRVPAFVAGGFMAKSLSAAQLLPYASNSLVHISDLHATILSLASSPFTSNAATTTTTAASSATSNLAAASSSSTSPTLDGVSQWAFWTSGAETTVQGKAFMPRTEILHNMNSEAFGSGGALRMGDFKLIVQPKVSESEVYTYAQHVLQVGVVTTCVCFVLFVWRSFLVCR